MVPEIIVALFCTLYIVIFLNLLIRFVETERKKERFSCLRWKIPLQEIGIASEL
ncbi:hypothetical protein GFC29_1361 [Anoxybacillus sp. B7M1]|nr:hypothetical protein GFC28_263 [Anoxybacillus sp. B2M1]ANB65491.1 hypothetical protein GFC29_1361 [Anoxybacillus sp. B7M1]